MLHFIIKFLFNTNICYFICLCWYCISFL